MIAVQAAPASSCVSGTPSAVVSRASFQTSVWKVRKSRVPTIEKTAITSARTQAAGITTRTPRSAQRIRSEGQR